MRRYRIVSLFLCPLPIHPDVWGFFVFVFTLLSSVVSIIKVFIISCSGFEPVRFFVDCLPCRNDPSSLGIKEMMLQHKQKENNLMFQSVRNDEFVGKARLIKCDGEDEKNNCDYWYLPLYSAQMDSSFTIEKLFMFLLVFFVLFLYLLILNIVRVCL